MLIPALLRGLVALRARLAFYEPAADFVSRPALFLISLQRSGLFDADQLIATLMHSISGDAPATAISVFDQDQRSWPATGDDPYKALAPIIKMLRGRNRSNAMSIEGTTFGTIRIDGKTYDHDVIIRLSGEVVKRKKKLSKKYYGTSHTVSKDEAKFVFEKGCDELVVGSGQMGNLHLSPEAQAYFAKKGCKVLLQPTPAAIRLFNRSNANRVGLFHVTC
jgi:hypothetical protein